MSLEPGVQSLESGNFFFNANEVSNLTKDYRLVKQTVPAAQSFSQSADGWQIYYPMKLIYA